MSTSKVSSPLKYSIATFLLCASTLATGVFIYPVGLAIFSSTMIPMLSAAVASVSAIIAMSAAIYLVKANASAIKARATYNVLEEKPNGDDISTKTPVITTVPPSSPAQDLKEPAANNTKTPKKAPVTFDTAIPQVPPTISSPPPPPPLPSQGVNVSPPPLLPTGSLKDWKLPKDNNASEKSLGGTSPKNPSLTELQNRNEGLQEELEKRLEKIRKQSGHLQGLTRVPNAEIKDDKDNDKPETGEEYAARIDRELKEKKKENNNKNVAQILARRVLYESSGSES
ncbi:MAG: hypothetical protein ACR5K9_04555 [Wolbachia sp.]